MPEDIDKNDKKNVLMTWPELSNTQIFMVLFLWVFWKNAHTINAKLWIVKIFWVHYQGERVACKKWTSAVIAILSRY